MRYLLAVATAFALSLGSAAAMAQSPDQATPDQAKPDQSTPDQAKPDQAKPDQSMRVAGR